MATSPVIYEWDGESMVPLRRFHNLVNDQFVVGERYRLAEVEERSMRSHSHFFASIAEAWNQLPEGMAERFPTPEALRKWALIKTGYRDERSIVAASKAEAQRVAAFVRPMDGYAVVVVNEAQVSVYTAKSQSMKAMGRKAFQESKTDVLDYIWGLVGVDPSEAQKHVGRAA